VRRRRRGKRYGLLIGTSGGIFNAIRFCRLVGEGFGFLGVRVGLVGRLLALHAFL
jgi:hypothetical protein